MNNQLKLKSYTAENQEFPGKDRSEIVMEFNQNIEFLEKRDRLIADFRDGQALFIKQTIGNKAHCIIQTSDKEKWFDQRHLQKDTEFFIMKYVNNFDEGVFSIGINTQK